MTTLAVNFANHSPDGPVLSDSNGFEDSHSRVCGEESEHGACGLNKLARLFMDRQTLCRSISGRPLLAVNATDLNNPARQQAEHA
jgi:hypothetical protein